ncbi:unnamed protein product [Tuber melanosporum]|uniref:(Perigord truffle) hypothetical protein n=1 Tax=Tuber melanosporum (strain Mel28) TaxID=656061 RepID=D5G7I6_TUBMM|nr:uncharacterized protein GSTUM_00002583001 [Tuber melanosporum]CAZ80479.1 unnamed protein product [Tuber melanosporum]
MSRSGVVVELHRLPLSRQLPTPILRLLALGVPFVFLSWVVYSRLPFAPNQHGRKLGVKTSNLADSYRHGIDALDAGQWRVKGLWIFPVKSCRGIEVAEARVIPSGIEHDRQFVFAEWKQNLKTGNLQWIFITQRQYPKMALITTEIYLEGVNDGNLHITFPIKSHLPFLKPARTIRFPLLVSEEFKARYPLKQVGIWKDHPLAYDISSAVETELRELSTYLCTKGPLALFRICPEELREVHRNAPTVNEVGYQPVTGFADAYPLHMLNLASVRELNSRITDSIPRLDILRFRANIILSGPSPFTEDDWKKIRLGGYVYYAGTLSFSSPNNAITNEQIACRTVRCKMPNVDPDTGERHMQEPDQTMRSYRAIDLGNKHGACLGMQLVPASAMGILRVGDGVDVLETGSHHYINL